MTALAVITLVFFAASFFFGIIEEATPTLFFGVCAIVFSNILALSELLQNFTITIVRHT